MMRKSLLGLGIILLFVLMTGSAVADPGDEVVNESVVGDPGSGNAAPSYSTETGYIYFSLDLTRHVVAFDPGSGVVWKKQLNDTTGRAVTVQGDLVFTGVGDDVIALDSQNGSTRWRTDVNSPANDFTNPEFEDGNIYTTTGNKKIVSLSAQTGDINWIKAGDQPDLFQGGAFSSLNVENGTIAYMKDDYFGAVDQDTGDLMWVIQQNGFVLRSPFFMEDEILFPSSGVDDYVISVDSDTGKVNYTLDFGGMASPVVGDGKLFLSDRNGTFYALDKDTQDVVWETNVGGYFNYMTYTNGNVYGIGPTSVNDQDQITKINASDGSVGWQRTARSDGFYTGNFRSHPLVLNGTVYSVLKGNAGDVPSYLKGWDTEHESTSSGGRVQQRSYNSIGTSFEPLEVQLLHNPDKFYINQIEGTQNGFKNVG